MRKAGSASAAATRATRTAKAAKAAATRARRQSPVPAQARATTRPVAPASEDVVPGLGSRLGPGLITGAADDDPSGIATYSQAGAQFRFALVWTLFLTTPLMIGIQMLSARIGWVTSEGLATNIDKICPRWLTLGLIGLLVIANTVNIAADVGAMAEAVKLLVGGTQPLYVLAIGAVCIATQVFFSYERTVRILKWLTLALFAYVALVLTVSVPAGSRRSSNRCSRGRTCRPATAKEYAAVVVAVLGTTISPYLFFWQATQKSRTAGAAPRRTPCTTRRTRASTNHGSSRTRSSGWACRTDRALHRRRDRGTLNSTASPTSDLGAGRRALRPVARSSRPRLRARHRRHRAPRGAGARRLGGVCGERAVRLEGGLSRGFHKRAASIRSSSPRRHRLGDGLFRDRSDQGAGAERVINGVISVPIMVVMMMIGQSASDGRFTISMRHRVFGWATAVMAAAVAVMFLTAL
jgi:Mn2+/Fe2+ NRAMP family transporter